MHTLNAINSNLNNAYLESSIQSGELLVAYDLEIKKNTLKH